MNSYKKELEKLNDWRTPKISGRVSQIIGLLIESVGPVVSLGEMCHVYNRKGEMIPCEVVGFKNDKVLLMSLGEMTLIAPGSEVYPTGHIHKIPVSESMRGRVIDALGNPLDGKGPIRAEAHYNVTAKPPEALSRTRISEVMETSIKSIDTTCTVGKGQRMGIFSGSGVGKSMLLGMIAKMAKSDINVIALIGERGREVREFIDKNLGPEGLARSVVVVVTSDKAALLRTKGANVATTIAEYFRDKGMNVILMMDSVTRYAMALREIGLAIGEPPATKGYTPSVFAQLPKLLERAGTSDVGSITGLYTVLVEGDDFNDPIADTVRSIIDGHIYLSRKLASANLFPAIDILSSLSRVMPDIVSKQHFEQAGRLRDHLQTYKEAEDLINIGAYVAGSNAKIDQAIALIDKITNLQRQNYDQNISFNESLNLLNDIASA